MCDTKIEWCDTTWNPVTGCTPVSEGCQNCYAAAMAKRFPQTHGGWDGTYVRDCRSNTERPPTPFSTVVCHPDRLEQPSHWRKPRVVFVCSMGDPFHEDVPDKFIASIWDIIYGNPRHTFLVLTKRPERMRHLLSATPFARFRKWSLIWPLPNVYLGVTAENQARLDERVFVLGQTPAAHRFVSWEPALGPLSEGIVEASSWIDWWIAGCESINGRAGRPAPHDWFRSLRNQCDVGDLVEYGNRPLFVKQMSENEDGTGKVVKMPPLDGRVWAQTPWDPS